MRRYVLDSKANLKNLHSRGKECFGFVKDMVQFYSNGNGWFTSVIKMLILTPRFWTTQFSIVTHVELSHKAPAALSDWLIW